MLNKHHRKKSSAWAPLVAGAILLLAATVATATGAATTDEHQSEMTAEIISVDTEAGTLTVKKMDAEAGEVREAAEYEAEKPIKDERVTLAIGESTQISEDGGNRIALAELEPGEFVNVVFEMKDGTMSAVHIERSSGG